METLGAATRIVWNAAGSPEPCEATGDPIEARIPPQRCSRCGSDSAIYPRSAILSSNFLPTRNENRIRAFGGNAYCAACAFTAKTLRLRCIAWFASARGVEFWPTRSGDAMTQLLSPPPAPFVVGIPLYGIAHGGEAHWQRTWWPGERPENILIRLQSKHVALYARTAESQDRYPVQVDDDREFMLDRDLWLRLREAALEAAELLAAEGIPPWVIRAALRSLRAPVGCSSITVRTWASMTAPCVPHRETRWWPIFCDLVPITSIKEDSPA